MEFIYNYVKTLQDMYLPQLIVYLIRSPILLSFSIDFVSQCIQQKNLFLSHQFTILSPAK